MVATSDRPERQVRMGGEARLAVDLANAYMNGHLPEQGGWLEQDSYYVRLIKLALSTRSRRISISKRKTAQRAKMIQQNRRPRRRR